MLTITICDDDINELSKSNKMCQAYNQRHPETDLRICSYSSPVELKNIIIQGDKSDIYLLDIYMPMVTGIELAQVLRENNEDSQIIFLTTSMNHAIEAFSLHAAHYLVKPYTQAQLEDALNKAILAIEKKNKQITLKNSDGIYKINFSDFIYSETNMHIQQIYLEDGNCRMFRMTSAELFKLLSSDSRFFKCGSTYIINLGKVEEITKNCIIFENGIKIPMQRRQYKDLVDQYTAYALEGLL
jgi:DNA-binding LytR/AlgR family response regulator